MGRSFCRSVDLIPVCGPFDCTYRPGAASWLITYHRQYNSSRQPALGDAGRIVSSPASTRWRSRSSQSSYTPVEFRSTVARSLPKSRLALMIESRSAPVLYNRLTIVAREHSAYKAVAPLG